MARLNMRDVPGFPASGWVMVGREPCEYCGVRGILQPIKHAEWGYPINVCEDCGYRLTTGHSPTAWFYDKDHLSTARIGNRNVTVYHDGDQWGLIVNGKPGTLRWETETDAKAYAEQVFSRKQQ